MCPEPAEEEGTCRTAGVCPELAEEEEHAIDGLAAVGVAGTSYDVTPSMAERGISYVMPSIPGLLGGSDVEEKNGVGPGGGESSGGHVHQLMEATFIREQKFNFLPAGRGVGRGAGRSRGGAADSDPL